MARGIKYSYLFQHDETGRFLEKIWSIQEIECCSVHEFDKDNYNWTNIARRQFTGLKDKNDKEIYEGDIVRLYDPYTKSELTTDVIWDDVNCRYTRGSLSNG